MTILSEKEINVLLIEDEEFDVRRVRNTVKPLAHTIIIRKVISNGRLALDELNARKELYDVIIMDFQIAGGLMGEQLIREIKKIDPTFQIIVVTKMTVNLADYDFANSLMQAGAYWYCTKYPGDIDEFIYQPTDFLLSIINAFQKRLLEKEQTKTKRKLLHTVEETLSQNTIIGVSPSIVRLRQQIEKCADSDANVIISGASGTGKELVAVNIHHRSKRRLENFVPINCGSIPSELVESELFGYEKGAFTGATNAKPGLFEMANHGTVFLDEITELPLPAQVKLLRIIQNGEVEKIGRRESFKVDVRLIAATNSDLEKEVEEKRFREDLYYRLNVVPITVPSLIDRREDIPLLADFFLQQFCDDMGRRKPEVDADAMSILQSAPWKGNVRELKNVVHRLLFLEQAHITTDVVRMAIGTHPQLLAMPGSDILKVLGLAEGMPLRDLEHVVRRKYIEFVRSNSSSDAEAAKKLGLAPPNYHRVCKDLGIK
jgi:Response regulator containing CheY-like receiver, AAA-type ATPase, and DNA-binding domains